jgi:anti-sigma B factor antagonist
VLDLSRVPYMDSTSLGTVLDALRSVRELDGDLRLVGLAANVKRVFDLMDGDRLFRMFATLEEGVASFVPAEAPAGA